MNKMEEYLLDKDFQRGCNNFEKEFNINYKENDINTITR
jgi:hypothetical protein